MLQSYLLGTFVVVLAAASDTCTSEDGECSTLSTAARASALLQVERTHKKEVTSHHHHHHGHHAHGHQAKHHQEHQAKHHQEQPTPTANKQDVGLLSTQPAQSLDTASSRFMGLAGRAAAEGFCTGHPCHASLLAQEGHGNGGASGKTASLTEAGYVQVVALKDDNEMKEFILRVIDKYDCKVEQIGGLMGIVPWFSGTTLSQNLEKLENTLLYAVLSDARKGSWLSYKNSDGVTGDTAELGFVGYVQVAATKSDVEMKKYVKRVCKEMGVKIVDEGGFTGMVKYYSGTDNFQSFDRLQSEVRSAANAPHSWAQWENPQAKKKEEQRSKGSAGFSMLALRAEKGFCKDFPCRVLFLQQENGPASNDHAGIGKHAELDQAGYEKVAGLKDDKEMTEFIRRVIDKYDCKVENEAGLSGIVPWFSGSTAKQDMEKLENTVLYAVLTFTQHPWISYKNSAKVSGENAELNFVGYVQVAAMRDDLQMQKFAKRVCDKMGVEVQSKPGFEGMVRFYSGTDNFQSYDKLQQEIKSAANAPNSWAKITNMAVFHKESGSDATGSQAQSQSSSEKHSAPAPAPAPALNEEKHEEKAATGNGVGDNADMNFAGYVKVASSRSNDEMKKFARRVCQKLNVKITDEGGFEGMVKFYVGPDHFQSYDALQNEIKTAAKNNKWAKFN